MRVNCWSCKGKGIDPLWQLYADADIILHTSKECIFCGGTGTQEFKNWFYWKRTAFGRKYFTLPFLTLIKKFIGVYNKLKTLYNNNNR